jgi:lipoprotein-anchoring transpeptidase ErfK/SrfK
MIRFSAIRYFVAPVILCAASPSYAQAQAEVPTVPVLPAEPVVTTEPAREPAVPPQPGANPPETTPPVATPPVIKPKPVQPGPKVVKTRFKKADPGDKLRPGQFVWENRTSYKNPLRIIAVLDFQRLYVFDGEELVAFTTISSGKKGHETPTGVFKILEKKIEHYSNLYNNAPMPHMQRLTWDGIALHAGAIPGYPASHGCIRMPATFAKYLFGATKMAHEVIVIQDTSKAARKEAEEAGAGDPSQRSGGEAGAVTPPPEPPK